MTQKANLAALFGATDASTFLGLAAASLTSPIAASSVFLGVPCATPYAAVGAYASGGPDSIRQGGASLTANLDRYNFDLGGTVFPAGTRPACDAGDLDWSDSDFAANRTRIADAVKHIMAYQSVPVLVGGDDSIPIPMLDALAAIGKTYTILQIDAHIDWRDKHMDENMGLSSTMRRASEMPHINTIIQVGARGIGSAHPDDMAAACAWGAQFFPAEQIMTDGIAPVLNTIPTDQDVVICFDIDALDPSLAPNTIGRAPGGLMYHHALGLIKGAAQKTRIAAMDFAEILPEADIDGIGGLTVSRLIAASMGVIARQDMARQDKDFAHHR
jgi:agmatinase